MALKPTRSTEAPRTHVVVYDGDCAFCTATAQWLERHARVPVRLVSIEDVDRSKLLTRLEEGEIEATAHYVTAGGIEYHGGEAMTRAFRLVRFGWMASPLDLPGLRYIRDAGYALVARARPWLSRRIHP
jgi:predicted DCC family thiol-disulfide oxidoreductase YuxK